MKEAISRKKDILYVFNVNVNNNITTIIMLERFLFIIKIFTYNPIDICL